MGTLRTLTAVAAGLLLGASAAVAQSTSGSLAGEVLDRAGAPVEGAAVQARSAQTGQVRIAATDAAGAFRIDLLPPGDWTVAARGADGRVSDSRTVRVGLQDVARVRLTLGAGLAETVEVSAARPILDPKRTGGRLDVGRDQISALPVGGRDPTELARLDAAVQPSAPGTYFGERQAVFVVNGQSGRSNSFLVDGLDNNDAVSGTTLNSFFSQEVIQEFVLLTSQYAAEFGRAAGGVMNIVTRRGGNERSAELFLQGTSDSWNGAGDFAERLPEAATGRDAVGRYQGGFTLGGPFKKDRAFYFLAYERQDARTPVPYTGVDRDGSAGGRLDAASDSDNLFFRTDFNLTDRQLLMLRLSFDDRSTEGVNVGGVYTAESGFRLDERDVALAGSLTSILGPRWINEVRFLAADSRFEQLANSSRPGVSRPSGIFGGNNLERQDRDETRFQVVENVTWVRGDHTVKFGLDFTRSKTSIATRFNPNGNYIYNSDAPFEPGDCFVEPGDLGLTPTAVFAWDQAGNDLTAIPCAGTPGVDDDGDGVVDEPANIESFPVVFSYIFGQPEATIRDDRIALFAQDQWQATPTWLFDYGLRYDVSTYELPASARVESTIPNGGAQRDTDNWAPRFGFTYTPEPGGDWIVRGGAGVFYDKIVLGFPAVAAITSGTSIGLSFPQGFAIEWPESFVEEQGIETTIETLGLGELFLDPLILRFSTETELETPYTVQTSLGIERRIGRTAAVRAKWTSANGYHVPLFKDLNPVDGRTFIGVNCSPENLVDQPEVGVPCHLNDTTTGSIAALATEGRTWYEGVDLGYRWQGPQGWFSASYTWSKAEDLGFDPLKGGVALPPDSRNLAGERGRADADRRHRLVISGEVPLPWAGIRLSGVYQVASGLPFNVTTGEDDNLDGILTDRPAGVGRNSGEDTPLDVVNALRLEEGLAPVDRLNEPSFQQVDVRLTWPFALNERATTGQFYLDVFNLLDRENGGLVEGRVLSRDFGRTITLAGPPRTIEMGLRLAF